MPIHPTAVVDPRAELDATADIGPYVVIDGPVTIGPRTRVLAHAFLTGQTTIGADNVIHPSAVVGHEPQDLKYRGAPTGLRVGDRNVIREHVEIHRGTAPETSTVIGDDNYFMGQSHVGHNSTVGSHVILASGALLAGHVTIEDQVFVSGNCVVHQFTRIGRLALLRGLSRTSRDVPPFALMDETHTIRGVNRVGLRRAGFDAARIRAVVNAYRTLFRVRVNLRDAMAEVEAGPRTPDVDAILAFIREAKRGVAMGPARPGAARDTGDDD